MTPSCQILDTSLFRNYLRHEDIHFASLYGYILHLRAVVEYKVNLLPPHQIFIQKKIPPLGIVFKYSQY